RHPAYATRVTAAHATDRHTVVVPHSALDNRLRWLQHHHPLAPDDRVLLHGPLTADTLAEELLWPLRAGATLVLDTPHAGASAKDGSGAGHGDRPAARTGAPGPYDTTAGRAEGQGAGPVPARRIRELDVTVVRFAPDALRRFLNAPGAGECVRLRHVLAAGGSPGPATVDRFRRVLPHAVLHHHVGPPEAAGAAHRTWAADGDAPDGPVRPAWNTRLHVLDPALRPCPPGRPGELYVSGAPLATGYPGHPARTAGRFPADPYGPPGTRMYRTGRRARRRADGGVELLDRTEPT
ncbi:AMP-binding protein, partial [Streptomyces sp. URMC 126]|uniref:AMP-binding protein n=1 Tax=Streptomyces sp. URMC 126 TaxID=3423401 RepID=UPI003F1C40E4